MDVPVLVVVGEEDVLTPPSESEAIAAALALGRLVRIPGAGHLSPLEKAGEFGEELSAFLSALA
jgi:pimeloyl-ACP methyl ester carboxylesterase